MPKGLHSDRANPSNLMKNELLEQVREARAALAAEHGYDSHRNYEWARAAHAARKHAQASPGAAQVPQPETEAGYLRETHPIGT